MIAETLIAKYGVVTESDACRALVEEHFPGLLNARSSVDVFGLAERAGIRTQRVETDLFDGKYTWNDDGNEEIILADQPNKSRLRFTLAHEIGHWLMRRGIVQESAGTRFRTALKSTRADQEEERLANVLAAEILLPLGAVVDEVKRSGISMRTINMLSRNFHVSKSAALRRVTDVLDTTLVYLNVVPNRFSDLRSPAAIDDAFYIVPREGLVYDRGNAKLLRRIEFREFASARKMRLGIRGSRGRVVAEFDIAVNKRPIPNADLLAHAVNFR
jgi:Zn-dependent peptidase ImmA (M78 family)